MDRIQKLIERIRSFNREREWEIFHTPKNLSMSIAIEAAEIMEHFQWLSGDESYNLSRDKLELLADEIADVFIYLLNLSDKLGIDIIKEANRKIDKNALKYPVERFKGSRKKYNEL